jgi:hypothetical protein
LRDLLEQVIVYKEYYPKIAVIIFDVGRMSQDDLKEALRRYYQHGVKSAVIKGVKEEKKKKPKYHLYRE